LRLVRATPVIFNEGGKPNRAWDYYEHRSSHSQLEDPYNLGGGQTTITVTRKVPVFAPDDDSEAGYWTVESALRYLCHFHVPGPIDTMDLGIEDMTHEEALEELEGLSKTLARARQQEIVVDDVPVDYPEDDEPPEETEDTELSTEELDNLIDRELEE
ncbi:hypothetical protein LCGC14_0414260, partial [marine sediment metagenome]